MVKNVLASQFFISEQKQKPAEIYSSWNLDQNIEKHKKHQGIKKSTSFAETITLDNFVLNNNINKKTLIKCDVDSYELNVFKSGESYLSEHKPIIIMELAAPYLYDENGYSLNDLLEYIKKFDYKFYEFNNIKEIPNIFEYAEKEINDGSSKNIILKK